MKRPAINAKEFLAACKKDPKFKIHTAAIHDKIMEDFAEAFADLKAKEAYE